MFTVYSIMWTLFSSELEFFNIQRIKAITPVLDEQLFCESIENYYLWLFLPSTFVNGSFAGQPLD